MAREMIVSVGAICTAVCIFCVMGVWEYVWEQKRRRAQQAQDRAAVADLYRFSYGTHPDVQVTQKPFPADDFDVADEIRATVERLVAERERNTE